MQLIPSDGTCVFTNDRPSSTCPATFNELRYKDGNNIEAMVMYGLTDQRPAELTALNRSWNFAPEVTDLQGCHCSGYEKRERAFTFTKTSDSLAFTIRASKEQPLENPSFVIANWGSPDSNLSLKLNGQMKKRGADYQSGIEVDTDGSCRLVIWRPYTMVYIDLDNFKTVNDALGHATGDLVLKTVVDAIHAQIRNTDFLARLGGDEFAVLLMDLDQNHAKVIVQRLHSSLLEKMTENEWEITFSIGVLTVLSMPESVDKLVNMTDALMYEVKGKGKDAVQYSVFE